MAFPHEFRTFPLEHLHEKGIGIRQGHHKERTFHQHAIEFYQSVSEIHLRLTGPVGQRHEYLAVPLFEPPDGFFHLAIATGVAILIAKALENTLGRMPLFFVGVFVVLQGFA